MQAYIWTYRNRLPRSSIVVTATGRYPAKRNNDAAINAAKRVAKRVVDSRSAITDPRQNHSCNNDAGTSFEYKITTHEIDYVNNDMLV